MNAPGADDLLRHLNRVYAFAQLVTPDPAAAVRLVRATYARAFEADATLPDGETARLYLYRLLLDVRREERGEQPAATFDAARLHDAPDNLAAPRERHAQRLVDLHLPPALVSLDTADRLLLLLCDVEGLPCEEAARVLDLPAEDACARFEQARATLRARMLASVSVHERAMMDAWLGPEELRQGIILALQDELAPVPPTLRPQIVPPMPLFSEPSPLLTEPATGQRWIRLGYLMLLATIIGVSAFLFLRRPVSPGETNLIVLAARNAPEARFVLNTADARAAEAFVEDHVGWRLSLPEIQGYSLDGVGIAEIAEEVTIPVFRYRAPGADTITLYAVSYALLDQVPGRVMIEDDVLRQLEDDAHFDLHDIEGTQVLVWRNRDDLYLAVSADADDLTRRVTP